MVETREPAADPDASPSLKAEAQGVWDETRALIADHAELFALEARRAGIGLVMLVVMGLAAAVLLVTAWFLLLAIAMHQALEHGVSFTVAALAVLVANLVIMGTLVYFMRREAGVLLFRRSVRQLRASRPGGGVHRPVT